jgi:hypothetical protein
MMVWRVGSNGYMMVWWVGSNGYMMGWDPTDI